MATGDPLPLSVGAKIWYNRNKHISSYSTFLNGGYFMQLPQKEIPQNTSINIDVTGSAKVYVAIYIQDGSVVTAFSGGFEQSLPQNGWTEATLYTLKIFNYIQSYCPW